MKIFEVTNKEELPFDIVEDMKVFMLNDKDFYRRHYLPTMVELQKKIKTGETKVGAELNPMILQACKMYNSKYNVKRTPDELLDNTTKKALMASIMKDELGKLRKEDY
jgi:hypothetical protein